MSKYIKLERVELALGSMSMFHGRIFVEDALAKIADLPTIEVSDDNKAYTYCSRCGMRVVVDAPSAVPTADNLSAVEEGGHIARREYAWNHEGLYEIKIETFSQEVFNKVQNFVELLIDEIEQGDKE